MSCDNTVAWFSTIISHRTKKSWKRFWPNWKIASFHTKATPILTGTVNRTMRTDKILCSFLVSHQNPKDSQQWFSLTIASKAFSNWFQNYPWFRRFRRFWWFGTMKNTLRHIVSASKQSYFYFVLTNWSCCSFNISQNRQIVESDSDNGKQTVKSFLSIRGNRNWSHFNHWRWHCDAHRWRIGLWFRSVARISRSNCWLSQSHACLGKRYIALAIRIRVDQSDFNGIDWCRIPSQVLELRVHQWIAVGNPAMGWRSHELWRHRDEFLGGKYHQEAANQSCSTQEIQVSWMHKHWNALGWYQSYDWKVQMYQSIYENLWNHAVENCRISCWSCSV